MLYKILRAWTEFDDENVTQLSLKPSQKNFVAIVDLPEGEHQYKFCVDGQWTLDPTGVRGQICKNVSPMYFYFLLLGYSLHSQVSISNFFLLPPAGRGDV